MGKRGLEPPTLAGLVPKTSAYTNSATCPITDIVAKIELFSKLFCLAYFYCIDDGLERGPCKVSEKLMLSYDVSDRRAY